MKFIPAYGYLEESALKAVAVSLRGLDVYAACKITATERGTPYVALPAGYRLYCDSVSDWDRRSGNPRNQARYFIRDMKNAVVKHFCQADEPKKIARGIKSFLASNGVNLAFKASSACVPTRNPQNGPWWWKNKTKGQGFRPSYYQQDL